VSKRSCTLLVVTLALSVCAAAQDKPRVFMAGHGTENGMTHGSAGGSKVGHGWFATGRSDSIVDSHDESMELAKDFSKNCTGVQVTVNQDAADYVTSLNRESKAKKGILSKNDQIMVSNKAGDVLLSSTVRSVSTAAKDACNIILSDFATHGHAKPAASAPASSDAPPVMANNLQAAATPQNSGASQNDTTELNISSTPAGADIEIDGRFVGNTPSAVSVTPGDHTVAVQMDGYQSWKRTINTGGGKVRIAATLAKAGAPAPTSNSGSLGEVARKSRAHQPTQTEGFQESGASPK
jgi:hypothetical protein